MKKIIISFTLLFILFLISACSKEAKYPGSYNDSQIDKYIETLNNDDVLIYAYGDDIIFPEEYIQFKELDKLRIEDLSDVASRKILVISNYKKSLNLSIEDLQIIKYSIENNFFLCFVGFSDIVLIDIAGYIPTSDKFKDDFNDLLYDTVDLDIMLLITKEGKVMNYAGDVSNTKYPYTFIFKEYMYVMNKYGYLYK